MHSIILFSPYHLQERRAYRSHCGRRAAVGGRGFQIEQNETMSGMETGRSCATARTRAGMGDPGGGGVGGVRMPAGGSCT